MSWLVCHEFKTSPRELASWAWSDVLEAVEFLKRKNKQEKEAAERAIKDSKRGGRRRR